MGKKDKEKKDKKKAKKAGNDYFEMFVGLSNYCCRAAVCLHDSLTNFEPDKLPETMDAMHEIEHTADLAKHDVMEKLIKEFLPPIEREDIIALTQMIDDVTDSIEDVLLKMYMYNIRAVREDALLFTKTILDCCRALMVAMEDFKNYKHSERVRESIIEINRLEEIGDKLYTEAVRKLYVEPEHDPVEVYAWTIAFSRLERCCDACEEASNLLETIIMKNS